MIAMLRSKTRTANLYIKTLKNNTIHSPGPPKQRASMSSALAMSSQPFPIKPYTLISKLVKRSHCRKERSTPQL